MGGVRIPYFNKGGTIFVGLEVYVNWKVCVDVSHLVPVALGDAEDEIVDDGPDGAEGGNIFALAMVDLDEDLVFLWLGEGDGNVSEVLAELSCIPLNPPSQSAKYELIDFVAAFGRNSPRRPAWMGLVRTSWTFNYHLPGLDGDGDCNK